MLAAKEPVPKIAKVVKVSQTTVERVRPEYRAVTFEAALDRLEKDDVLPEIEYKRADRRAREVDTYGVPPICEGSLTYRHAERGATEPELGFRGYGVRVYPFETDEEWEGEGGARQ